MWKVGLFHPDSYSLNNTQNLSNIENGTTLISLYQHYSDYIVGEIQSVVEGYYLTPSVPPKFDGGGTVPQYLSSGVYGLTGIKKASDDRVEEMLRIVDWFSAPFGTQEYILSTYGVKDWDYSRNGSNFSKTATGKVETGLQVAYIGYAPPVVYVEGHEKATRDIYDYGTKTVPTGVLPADIGLYSPTAMSSKNAQLDKMMDDRIRDVITGRKSLEDWDSSVKAWKSSGGDQMAQEYEQSWKQTNA
jgi:putative aldouronate transport system substrate-binding protein